MAAKKTEDQKITDLENELSETEQERDDLAEENDCLREALNSIYGIADETLDDEDES